MRYLSLILLVLLSTLSKAQVYTATEMYVHIFSPAPIVDIEAVSNIAKAKLNITKKEVEIEIPINSFTFKKALMQTHFNEKYIESQKYPTATFKGKFKENLDLTVDGIYQANFEGKFSIHGVDRNKTISCVFTVKQHKVIFDTKFVLLSADYKIKAPDVIYRKVGQEVNVEATGILISN